MIGRTYFALAGRTGGMQVAGDGVKTRFGKIMIWFFANARAPRGLRFSVDQTAGARNLAALFLSWLQCRANLRGAGL